MDSTRSLSLWSRIRGSGVIRASAGLSVLAAFAATSRAGEFNELESQGVPVNNTIGTADPIPDALFSTTTDPSVYGGSGSIGNVTGLRTATILGRTGVAPLGGAIGIPFNNDVDFYRFTAGGLTWLDVDGDTGSTGVALYDAAGTLIAYSRWSDTEPVADTGNTSPDPGSGANFSMGFLGAIRLAPGTYYAAVYPGALGASNAPHQIRAPGGPDFPTMQVHDNPQTPFVERGLRMDPPVAGSGEFLVQDCANISENYVLHITTQGEAIDGLMAEWLAEGSAADGTGNHPGTLLDGASFGPGAVGQAFDLAAAEARVSIPDSVALRLNQYTVMAWLRLEEDADLPGVAGVVTKADSGVPGAAIHAATYSISILGADAGADVRRIRAGYEHPVFREDGSGIADPAGHFLLSRSPVEAGEFVHVALTYDADDVRLYVNGVLEGQSTTWFKPNASGSAVVIGGYDARPEASKQHFPGIIDQVRIYNRALSAMEILDIHAGEAPDLSAAIAPLADIVRECDDGEGGAAVAFDLSVLPGSADLLRVIDVTGDRTLLEVSDPVAGDYDVASTAFPHGDSSILIELLDGTTVVASATMTIRIQDTTAPSLAVPGSVTVEAASPLGTAVSLGSATASDAGGPVTVTNDAPALFHLGTTIVTWTATDSHGLTTSKTQSVTVRDTTAPTVSVSGLPGELWPPNHKMVRIQPILAMFDAGDIAPSVTLQVTSSEADDGLGDGDTAGDIVVHSPVDFEVRAERSGGGTGRTYTLVWTATDASGNATTLTASVRVPNSQGK